MKLEQIIKNQVANYVKDCFWSTNLIDEGLCDNLFEEVKTQVSSQVDHHVYRQLWNQVYMQTRVQVCDKLDRVFL